MAVSFLILVLVAVIILRFLSRPADVIADDNTPASSTGNTTSQSQQEPKDPALDPGNQSQGSPPESTIQQPDSTSETDLITWLKDHNYNIGWETAENDPYGTMQKEFFAYIGSELRESRFFSYIPATRVLWSYTTDGIGVTYEFGIRLSDDIPTEWEGQPYQNIPRKLQGIMLEIALMFEDPQFSRAMLTDYLYQWEAWDLYFHFPPDDYYPEGETVHITSDKPLVD